MKISFKYIGAALLGVLAMTACDDNFERPPMIVPTADIIPNMSIADFKNAYWQDDVNYAEVVPDYNTEGRHIVIGGTVISSDETGNIYNTLVIQDGTAAIKIAVKAASSKLKLYQQYLYGQHVVVDVTGLYVGKYNGLMQLGALGDYRGTPCVTFTTEEVFKPHAQCSGLANAANIDTVTVTLAELKAAKANPEGLMKWQNQLIRIDGVEFENAGEPFALSSPTSRYAFDADGNRINVYNSNYATFHNDLLPYGPGSLVGVLGYFGSDWQLQLIDAAGCIGFDPNYNPDMPHDPVTVIDQNFDSGTAIPKGWKQKQIAGNKSWYVTTFNDNNYAAMTGYKGTAPFDQWLITPPIDLSKAATKNFTFDTQVNGYGSKTTTLEVYVLDTANPATAKVKAKLEPTLATAPSSGYSSWVSSGNLDLSSYTGIVFIAFRYAATADANFATWCVDNVKIGVPAAQ